MINTIFYFVDDLSLSDYQAQCGAGKIADNTIVFAKAQKAIYKGGDKYGGLSVSEFHDAVEDLYDDSWIKDQLDIVNGYINDANARIDSLNELIIALNSRLNGQINNLDSDIQTKIESLFRQAKWIRDNWPQGSTEWDERWDENIKAYLSTLGVWDIDKDGNVVTQWTKLTRAVNLLEAQVANITQGQSGSEALSADIELIVNQKIAELNLGTTYAKVEEVAGLQDVIAWMYSGLQTQASEDLTFSQIQSAGKDALKSAIAQIRTQMQKLENGDYVAESTLTAKVKDSLASLITQASNDNVLAALSAKADANSTNISALLLGMTGSSSTADIQTRVANKIAGFLSTSNLDTAIAGIFAQTGPTASPTARAAVMAMINNNKSSLTLTADDILVSGATTVAGKLTALEGLVTNSVSSNILHAYSGNLTDLSNNANGSHVVINDGKIEGYKANGTEHTQDMYAFNANGSGYVANGNIAWDADGNVTINSRNVNAGSTYNAFEIYRWIQRPSGFHSYQESNPYNEHGPGYFTYETTLGYKIIKNGFVVKDQFVKIPTALETPSSSQTALKGGPYQWQDGVIGSSIGQGGQVTQGWRTIKYSACNFVINSVDSEHVRLFLNNIKTTYPTIFDAIFKDASGSYLFKQGDNLYVQLPDSKVYYNPTSMLLDLDQVWGFNYHLVIESGELTNTLADFYSWELYKPILWANTDQTTSPYLYQIIMLMLNDLGLTAAKQAEVYQGLFYYNYNPESVIRGYFIMSNPALDAGYNEGSHYSDVLNLNKNVAELYEIWSNRNVTVDGDHDQTYVDKWNQYKTDYVTALNAGNYTKGQYTVITDADIDMEQNTTHHSQYYSYVSEKISNALNNVGRTVSSTVIPIVTDPDIEIAWSDIITNQ